MGAVFGADTETERGYPYTFQVFGDGLAEVVFVNRRSVLETFLTFLHDRIPSGSRLYLHYLEFDLPVLFYPFLKAFKASSFVLENKRFEARVFCGKVNFCRLRVDDKSWTLVDTWAFFKGSLASLSRTFNLPPKLDNPPALGKRRYTGKALAYFKRYALRDAEVAFALGKEIEAFHRRYDVKPSISAPQLSASIFKHRFIPEGRSIPANPADLDEAAVLSYHGGKNGLYVDPGIYEGVKVYDINSAYPFAMAKVPNFLGCEYKWGETPTKLRKLVGEPGIYRIEGESIPDPYNPLRDHAFKNLYGPFSGIWVTSYEYETLVRHGFVRGLRVREVFTVCERERRPRPLGDFVQHFFKLKGTEKGPLREFYKIMLNSLYGKFVQNIQGDDGMRTIEWENQELKEPELAYIAGGLWNPLLGSLITGFVRAHLTELEIAYGSLHSSTDSIMVRRRLPTGEGLGELTLKTEGTALILRPKLYLVWDKLNVLKSYALHGYHGYLPQFLSMLRSGKRTYFHQRIRKPKESFRRNVQPLTMERFFKKLNLAVTDPFPIPRLTLEDGDKVRVL